MRALVIEEPHIAGDAQAGFLHGVVGVEIYLLVFE